MFNVIFKKISAAIDIDISFPIEGKVKNSKKIFLIYYAVNVHFKQETKKFFEFWDFDLKKMFADFYEEKSKATFSMSLR